MFKDELIGLLNDPDIPDDVHVFLASDEEGNNFYRVYEIGFYANDPDGDDDSVIDIDGPAIVLWP